jgi:IS30 family transposase
VNINAFLNYQFREALMPYTHLSQTERYQISSLLECHQSIAEIAKQLRRHASTIRREIKRGTGERGYRAGQAQRKANERSLESRNACQISQQTWQEVDNLIRIEHSPEQIAGQLPVSHESVYQYIYNATSVELRLYLRCQKKRKKRYGSGRSVRCSIPNRRSIDERSPAVQARRCVGHWEADTVISKEHKGVLLTLVERKSGFLLMKLLPNKSAQTVSAAMIELLKPFKHMVSSITCDNGTEFARHEAVDAALGCTTYFADPYCSWQRGTNENTNGLIRQYIPKTRCFDHVTHDEIQMIQDKLNYRPRKRLNFKNPDTIFYNSIKRRALRT